jgi:hypothetical protein
MTSPSDEWAYLVLRLTDNNWAAQITELNHCGRQGWELVAVIDGLAYLKQPTCVAQEAQPG